MTARQQLKYLEDQARQTETQQEQQQDLEQQQESFDKPDLLGTWTPALVPLNTNLIQVKITMSTSDEGPVGKRKPDDNVHVRLNRLKKRRTRITDSDEEDPEPSIQEAPGDNTSAGERSETAATTATTAEQSRAEQPGTKDEDQTAAEITNKLLGRAKKAKEKVREKEAAKKAKVEKEQEGKAKTTELSIPKKSGIPRKTVEKKEFSSLLTAMPNTAAATSAKTNLPPPASAEGPDKPLAVPTKTPSTSALHKKKSHPTGDQFSRPVSPRQDITRSPVAPKPEPLLSSGPTSRQRPPQLLLQQQSNVRKPSSLANQIWDTLQELCSQLAEDKDSKFRLSSASSGNIGTVDLSASFLKYRDYDFFDVDQNGAIVIQPKIPIFPEDFPPGKPEWPLQWWGIVDPALGERKDRRMQDSMTVDKSSSPVRDASSRRSGESPAKGPSRSRIPGPPPSRTDYLRDESNGHRAGRGPPPRGDRRGRGGPMPPFEHRGPPLQDNLDYRGHHVPEYRGPPFDHPEYNGPPRDHQDYRGVPREFSDYRGPPSVRGMPLDHSGPPPGHPDYRGPPPPMDRRGPPTDHRASNARDFRGLPHDLNQPQDRRSYPRDRRLPQEGDDRGSRARHGDRDKGDKERESSQEKKRTHSPEW